MLLMCQKIDMAIRPIGVSSATRYLRAMTKVCQIINITLGPLPMLPFCAMPKRLLGSRPASDASWPTLTY